MQRSILGEATSEAEGTESLVVTYPDPVDIPGMEDEGRWKEALERRVVQLEATVSGILKVLAKEQKRYNALQESYLGLKERLEGKREKDKCRERDKERDKEREKEKEGEKGGRKEKPLKKVRSEFGRSRAEKKRSILNDFKAVDEMEQDSSVCNMDQEDILHWLDKNNLSHLKHLYDSTISLDNTAQDLFSKLENSNLLSLDKCSKSQLLEFLDLDFDCPLSQIWNTRDFVRDFVLTYQAFMSLDSILKHLSNITPENNITKGESIKRFFTVYFKYLKTDIIHNVSLQNKIVDFANSLTPIFPDISHFLHATLTDIKKSKAGKVLTATTSKGSIPRPRRSLSSRNNSVIISKPSTKLTSSSNPPSPPREFLVATSPDPESLKWSSFFGERVNVPDPTEYFTEAAEMARQLSFEEQRLWFGVCTGEFLCKGWTVSDIPTPNLDKYIEWTNKVSSWMTREILAQPTPQGQADAITLFIEVSNHLSKLSNFNGVNEVLASLHSPPISKLKTAWALVNKKSREDFANQTQFMSPDNHYHNYNEHLNALPESTPMVPFLSPTLRDLFFVEEVHATVQATSEQVNWCKMAQVGKVLASFRRFSEPYGLRRISGFVQHWERIEGLHPKAAYEIAKLRDRYADFKWEGQVPKSLCRNSGDEIDWFNHSLFNDSELQLILLGSEGINMKEGTELVSITTKEKVFYLDHGEIQIQLPKKNGHCVWNIQKNNFVGLESLLKSAYPQFNYPVRLTVSPQSSARIRPINIAHLLKTLSKEPRLNLKLAKTIVGRLALFGKQKKQNLKGDESSLKLPTAESEKFNTELNIKGKKSKKSNFEEEFDLYGDVVIKEFHCCYHKNISVVQGTLYVTQNHLCFAAADLLSWVTGGNKITVDTTKIGDIQQKGKSIVITILNNRSKADYLEFSNFKKDELALVFDFLKGIWYQKLAVSPVDEMNVDTKPSKENNRVNVDWEKIDQSCHILNFAKGEIVLYPTNHPDRSLYKVKTGKVKIVYENSEEYELSEGSIFGIETFFLNSSETSKVISQEDNTKIFRYDGMYLDLLEHYEPTFISDFYLHLAIQLTKI